MIKINGIGTLSLIILGLILFIILGSTLGRRAWQYWKYKRLSTPLPVGTVNFEKNTGYKNIIFLHHSTGRNLVEEGSVRKLLTEKGYQFYTHDYNSIGLTDPHGKKLNFCYDIPTDSTNTRGNGNTDPEGLYILFNQPVTTPPSNAFSRLLQHDIIIFKSCFPNSAIKSEKMLNQYKDWFRSIRSIMESHPDKIFIPLTFPPLHPLATNSTESSRAREWANWLTSDDFLQNTSNVFVFNLFDYLADPSTNMLRTEYQKNENYRDSHPNEKANKIVGPEFARFIDQRIQEFKQKKIKASLAGVN